ncbi:hypothetical protein BTW26_10085 [Pediococcus acidilactici]|uniref:hypothetical protein n=1 Tax=Pediococcus acidilactici TaxID=1254 RepID=UPI0009473F29|nr:hypothetical protein [Pediococcus acidilactici]APR29333.1 hypothetical protein BTW26_10085 [Pediococcus acidilactici]
MKKGLYLRTLIEDIALFVVKLVYASKIFISKEISKFEDANFFDKNADIVSSVINESLNTKKSATTA